MNNWVFAGLAVVGVVVALFVGSWMGEAAVEKVQGPTMDDLDRRRRALEESERQYEEALRRENEALRNLEAGLREAIEEAERRQAETAPDEETSTER